jgi:hypothetical protein
MPPKGEGGFCRRWSRRRQVRSVALVAVHFPAVPPSADLANPRHGRPVPEQQHDATSVSCRARFVFFASPHPCLLTRWLPLAPAFPRLLRQSSSRGMPACLRVDSPHRLFVKKTPNCRGNSPANDWGRDSVGMHSLAVVVHHGGKPCIGKPSQCWMRWHRMHVLDVLDLRVRHPAY